MLELADWQRPDTNKRAHEVGGFAEQLGSLPLTVKPMCLAMLHSLSLHKLSLSQSQRTFGPHALCLIDEHGLITLVFCLSERRYLVPFADHNHWLIYHLVDRCNLQHVQLTIPINWDSDHRVIGPSICNTLPRIQLRCDVSCLRFRDLDSQ